jgi:hypothetical protein
MGGVLEFGTMWGDFDRTCSDQRENFIAVVNPSSQHCQLHSAKDLKNTKHGTFMLAYLRPLANLCIYLFDWYRPSFAVRIPRGKMQTHPKRHAFP